MLLTLTLFTASYAHIPDKSVLERFLDRLAEMNKTDFCLKLLKILQMRK